MSVTLEKLNKVIAITAPDKIAAKINAEDKQRRNFMAEYDRYKINKKAYPELQLTPDAYPLMLELFEACKKHLRGLTLDEIQRQQDKVSFRYFGRSLLICLCGGDYKLPNQVYLAICFDESNPSPFAVIGGFKLPEHWD